MSKIYYKCSKCHSIVGIYSITKVMSQDCKCPKTVFSRPVYACLHNYWYELLWMKFRDFMRK